MKPPVPILLLSLALAGSAAAQIKWAPDLDTALARAKTEKRLVFIAINMDGERANQELLADHYRDARLVKLSRNTVNVFCTQSKKRRMPGLTVDQQNHCDFEVRTRILNAGLDTWVVAPQHLWVSAEGKILSSVQYQVTKGELEWAWVDAIRKVDEAFAWKLSEGARAPARLLYEGKPAAGSKSDKPPTKEAIDEILDDFKQGGIEAWLGARESIPVLLRSDDKRAIELCEGVLAFLKGKRRAEMIDGIGKTSPRVWWSLVARYVPDKDKDVRRAAVEALGRLGEPKAAKVLAKAARKKREDSTVRGCILIAWARCAPKDKKLARLLVKAERDGDRMFRSRALIAAGKLEQRKAVTKLLAKGLADRSMMVRMTAAWVIAQRRDKELLQHVRAAADMERDEKTKRFMTAADAAIGGGSLEAFKDFEKNFEG